MLPRGATAPDFELPGTHDAGITTYRLSDALDRGTVVLVFYPFDFHPTCTEEFCTLRDFGWIDIRPDVTVFGIGPDSVYSHRAYHQRHGFDFALLSDFNRSVAAQYDVALTTLEGHHRVPRRTLYAIDRTASICYRWQANGPQTETDIQSVVRSLDA